MFKWNRILMDDGGGEGGAGDGGGGADGGAAGGAEGGTGSGGTDLLTGNPPETPWHESLGDEFKGSKSLSKFKGPEDLAKSYLSLEAKIGADTIAKPGDKATDEELGEYYKSLGRPDQPSAYEIPTENMAADLSDDDHAGLRKIAHDAGLDPRQFAKLTRGYAGIVKEMHDQMGQKAEATKQQEIAELQVEFGGAFEENINFANGAIARFGGDELLQILESRGLKTNPVLVKALAKIGKAYASDEIHGEGRQGFALSPAEAKAQHGAFMADTEKQKALMDRNHPQHAAVMAERERLFGAMHPEPAS